MRLAEDPEFALCCNMGSRPALGIDKKFTCASFPRRRYFLDILCWNSSLGNGLDLREMPRRGGITDDADAGCRCHSSHLLAQPNTRPLQRLQRARKVVKSLTSRPA